MKINSEFDKRVVVHSRHLEWQESPMAGVFRRPLDRVGNEVARATSIVKYMPGSSFSPHVHTGGEEFVVLDGVFQDEHGDFPVGSYIRNPPQSQHKPGSENGCVIFVKLWQFQSDDRTHVRLNERFMRSIPVQGFDGVSITPLYADTHEDVSIETWDADIELEYFFEDGAELLVLEGLFFEGEDVLEKHSWLRLPLNSRLKIRNGNKISKIWIKRGHLKHVDQELARLPLSTVVNS